MVSKSDLNVMYMYAFSIGTAFQRRGVFIILKLAVTRGLGLNGLSGRITQFSRFLWQTFRGTENLFQPKSHKSQDVLPQIPGCIIIFNIDIQNKRYKSFPFNLRVCNNRIKLSIFRVPWAKIIKSPKTHLCQCLPNFSKELLEDIVVMIEFHSSLIFHYNCNGIVYRV